MNLSELEYEGMTRYVWIKQCGTTAIQVFRSNPVGKHDLN